MIDIYFPTVLIFLVFLKKRRLAVGVVGRTIRVISVFPQTPVLVFLKKRRLVVGVGGRAIRVISGRHPLMMSLRSGVLTLRRELSVLKK